MSVAGDRELASRSGTRSVYYIFAIVAAVYVLLLINWPIRYGQPHLRFTSYGLRTLTLATWAITPLLMLAAAAAFPPSRKKVVAVVGSILLAAGSMIVGSAFSLLRSPEDLELLKSVKTPSGVVHAYRTNGGATTAFGVRFQKERVFLPGIAFTRDLDGWYPAYEVDMTLVEDGQLRIIIPAYGGDTGVQTDTVIDPEAGWP